MRRPRMHLAPYLLVLLVAAAVLASQALRYASPLATWFAVTMLGLSGWAITSGLCLAAADLATKAVWYQVEWLAFTMVPTTWLLFAVQFATGGLSRRAVLLALPGLGFLALAWTNAAHGLMWHALVADAAPLPTLDVQRGPGYWAFTAYAYAQAGAAVVLLVRALWRLGRPYRQQGVALALGTAAPLLANLVYNLQLGPIPNWT